ncbi:DUF975 family protein [Paenibacillus sp. SI8]|uniref:DUF975 family protein n=1 Tax=unclassified Paenibacillus TaxID=185978 RepID=UPI003465D250
MWTRRELKARAKHVLRTSYWKALVVSLLLAFISGELPTGPFNFGGGGRGGNHIDSSTSISNFTDGFGDIPTGALITIIAFGIVIAVIVALVVIAFRVFVCAPLEVGIRQYFKQAAQSDVRMDYLGYAFIQGRYLANVKAMLWKDFLNFLWYLLFLVPGIVKSYAYSLVPYILADNPGIGTYRAVELSNRMTRGHKWKMFVLDLSFIGWYLLGSIALLVGVLFVLPYVNSTKAELYLAIRGQALSEGICSSSELNLPEWV